VSQQIEDEGFHEIQLNGKQLVFLFMAATVVSVVIFLCGVLVGRGVRSQLGGGPDTALPTTVSEVTPTQPATPAPAPAAGSDPTRAAVPPPPPSDELSYFNRLEKQTAPAEQLKPPAAKEPARTPAPSAPPVPAVAPASAEPAGQGFAVQIAALNVRSEADAIAKRLSTKGYAAYVLTPANGTPSVFRVRVGKFTTRREAETVAARLQKEEQFKPWVTR
jgi:septal ring-binding cell division protein DamX